MHAIIRAIVEDDRERAKKLLKADATLATLLNREARLFQSQIFHWLYVGDTPLHLAAAGYRMEIVRTLLAAGADVNAAANHRRSTPLHYAADGYINGPAWDAKRQVKTIQCLLAAGADLQAQDKNGATALHRAVRTRSAAAVSSLLKAGGNPTTKNKPGSTPFHLAVQNTGRGGSGSDVAIAAQRRIIREFLAFGVSAKLKDGSGKSVVDCATSGWVREMLGGNTQMRAT
jgi:Ankyrin repeats (many copies)/Ankyrin repeats (3 copies)